MEQFTPTEATIGGALIGLAAVLLMALNGRIAGISGILHGAILGGPGDRLWRVLFLAGVLAGPLLYTAFSANTPPFEMTENLWLIIAGGILVGFGTRLGSGCTSGHGVCGLSRLSGRSLVAVLLFMSSGMATVTILRHVIGG